MVDQAAEVGVTNQFDGDFWGVYLMVEQEDATSGTVFVVTNGRAHRRTVKLGGYRRDLLWIQEGLTQSDQVIVEIGPSLKEGTPVKIATGRAATDR